MTAIRTAETTGFARADVKAVARRQLTMSIGLVGVLFAATLIATFAAIKPEGQMARNGATPTQQVLIMSSRG